MDCVQMHPQWLQRYRLGVHMPARSCGCLLSLLPLLGSWLSEYEETNIQMSLCETISRVLAPAVSLLTQQTPTPETAAETGAGTGAARWGGTGVAMNGAQTPPPPPPPEAEAEAEAEVEAEAAKHARARGGSPPQVSGSIPSIVAIYL